MCGPNYVCPHKKPNEQVRSKRTSQIWRPSKIPADAGSQVLFSRIYLKKMWGPNYVCRHKKTNEQVRSKCNSQIWRPSKIAADARSQVLSSMIHLRINVLPKTMYALTRSPTNKSVRNVPPKSDGLQNFQPTLDHRLIFKDLSKNNCAAPTM